MSENPVLRSDSSIAVLVPHFECEEWLVDCLESLVMQTRLPEAIIVIDDASPVPPIDCVRQFPSVTLLEAVENVGPYRLIQQVIDDTDFDGYMFQDADDWSGRRRLELLLAECERSGAELVGCQEMRIFPDGIDAEAHRYPLDANELILSGKVSYTVMHPSSVVSRDLVMRLGGYATGLRIAGDSEFQRRAVHLAHVTNIPDIAYYRRVRPGSLTASPVTGRRTAMRDAVESALREKWKQALAAIAADAPVDLSPIAVRAPVELRHVCGPRATAHRPAASRRAPEQQDSPIRNEGNGNGASGPPIFITGAPGSGIGLLYAALANHPALRPVPGAAWLIKRLRELETAFRGETLERAAAKKLASRRWREIMPPFDAEWRTCMLMEIQRGVEVEASAVARPSLRLKGSRPELQGRWLDGSPEYALCIDRIHDLFPDALIVHVLREPDAVAQSIVARGPRLGVQMTSAEAYVAWSQHVESLLASEQRLGPSTIRRLFHADLCADPERSIRGVLDLIGENFSSDCMAPVRFFTPDSAGVHDQLDSGVTRDDQLDRARQSARADWAAIRALGSACKA